MNPVRRLVHPPALPAVGWIVFCVCVCLYVRLRVEMVIDGATPAHWQSESLLTQIGRDPGLRNS